MGFVMVIGENVLMIQKARHAMFFHLVQGYFHGYERNNNQWLNFHMKQSTFQQLLQLLKLYGLGEILEDIEEKQLEITEIFCDNKSTISRAKNSCLHSRSKHIAIKYHFIKEAIEENEIQLSYCKSQDQMADILTKVLPTMKFQMLRKSLGVQDHYIKGGDC